MRFLFELAVAGILALIAFAIVFGVTWAIGGPFGFKPGKAAYFAGVVICFWLPAFFNVHDAVSGPGRASPEKRIGTGLMALGQMMCSAVLTAWLIIDGFSLTVGVSLFVAGSLFWWGSFAYLQMVA